MKNCGKRIYQNSFSANMAIARAVSHKYTDKQPIRSYYCPHCDGWHTTSKTLVEYKKKRELYEQKQHEKEN